MSSPYSLSPDSSSWLAFTPVLFGDPPDQPPGIPTPPVGLLLLSWPLLAPVLLEYIFVIISK